MSRSKVSILLFFGFLLQSCSSMNSAEINYTKDPEMEIGNDAGRNFQNYVYSIKYFIIKAINQFKVEIRSQKSEVRSQFTDNALLPKSKI